MMLLRPKESVISRLMLGVFLIASACMGIGVVISNHVRNFDCAFTLFAVSRRQLPLLADLGAVIPRSCSDDREQSSTIVEAVEAQKTYETNSEISRPDTSCNARTETLEAKVPLPSKVLCIRQVDAEVQTSFPVRTKIPRQYSPPMLSVFLVLAGLLLGVIFSSCLDLVHVWDVCTDEVNDGLLGNAVCLSKTGPAIDQMMATVSKLDDSTAQTTSKLNRISNVNVTALGGVVASALEGVVGDVLEAVVNDMNNASITKILMGAVTDALEMVVADLNDALRAVGSETEVMNFATTVGDTLAAVVTDATDVNDIQDVLTAVVVDTLTAAVSDAIAPPPIYPPSGSCACDRLADVDVPLTTTIWAMAGQKVGFSIDYSRIENTSLDKTTGSSHSACESTSYRWLKTGDPAGTGHHSFIHTINVTANMTAASDGPGEYTQWALCRNSAGAVVDTALGRVVVEMVSVPRLRHEPKVMQVGPGDTIIFDVREQVLMGDDRK